MRTLALVIFLMLAAPGFGVAAQQAHEDAQARAERVLAADDYQTELPGTGATAARQEDAERRRRSGPRLSLPSAAGSIASGLAWVVLGGLATAALLALGIALQARRRAVKAAAQATRPDRLDRDPLPGTGGSGQRSLHDLVEAGAWSAAARRLLGLAIEHLEKRGARRLAASLTSREILVGIGDPVERRDFAALVAAVERSHFGMLRLDRADFERLDVAYQRLRGEPAP